MFIAPLEDWRRVSVHERKTKIDWAEEFRELVDVDFPEAKKIVLVMDNLNTHTGSLIRGVRPSEARRIF